MAAQAKVLLAEDDPNMLSVLRMLLELEGYTVLTIAGKQTLDEIVEYIEVSNPDILYLDVHLRNVNGMDVLQQIRLAHPNSPMRVVMSSGMDLSDRCLAAGANAFVMKPFMPDELLEKLRG